MYVVSHFTRGCRVVTDLPNVSSFYADTTLKRRNQEFEIRGFVWCPLEVQRASANGRHHIYRDIPNALDCVNMYTVNYNCKTS